MLSKKKNPLSYGMLGQKGVRVVLSKKTLCYEIGTKGGQGGAESKCLASRGVGTKGGQSGVE